MFRALTIKEENNALPASVLNWTEFKLTDWVEMPGPTYGAKADPDDLPISSGLGPEITPEL